MTPRTLLQALLNVHAIVNGIVAIS